MSLQVEVRCPHCDCPVFKRIGEAVTVSRGPAGVRESKEGVVYGCCKCGGAFTVTRTEVLAPQRVLPKSQPQADGPKPPMRRNPDADLIMSPERMPG